MFKIRFTPLETKCTKANLRSPKGDLSLTGFNKRGIVLFIVLGTLLVVVSLVTVILSLILSHARLTHHQTSRIQAYYASMAGINYALEKLRLGSPTGWITASCPAPDGCLITDADFPTSIQNQQVKIIIIPAGSPGCSSPPVPTGNACVSATADYSYTNP